MVQQARTVGSTQVKTADRVLSLQPIAPWVYGRGPSIIIAYLNAKTELDKNRESILEFR
jgi:hypothetical protein